MLQKARLLTLSGAAGCGKTSLAIEFARNVASGFPDGAWLAELAQVSEAGLVSSAVTDALGVPEEPGRPFIDVLADFLATRHLLLVLDNCEHVLEGAVDLCEVLLTRCREVRILATSRQVLGVDGEQNAPVPPLGVPAEEDDADAVAGSEAGTLFLDRARAVAPSIRIEEANAAAVASICRRLDGIPLAIELAAARAGLLSPLEIAERLGDRFRLLRSGAREATNRHRTLRELIDWSYDLLPEDEAVLYRRLGVFIGGFTMEAAEQVCSGETPAREATLDLLGQLVEKSLVVAEEQEGHTRYRMLETVREYSLDQLRASGEERELRSRHLAWYVSFLERSDVDLAGPEQAEATRRMEREFGNVRAAFSWALASGEIESALRLVTIRRFWQAVQGRLGEAVAWIDAAIERADEAAPPLRAKALAQAGDLARVQGDLDRARTYAERCLSILRDVEDQATAGRTLYVLGRVESAAGNDDRAYEVTEQSAAIARAAGERQLLGERLSQLGEITYHRGDSDGARSLLDEAIRLGREAGDAHTIADALRTLGAIELSADNIQEARSLLSQATALQRELSDWACAALTLSSLGQLALMEHDPGGASSLFAEALSLQLRVGQWFRMVDCVWGLAAAAAGQGRLERAALLLGAEETLRLETGAPFRLASGKRHDAVETILQKRMSEVGFEAAFRDGRGMGKEEALAYALVDQEAESGVLLAARAAPAREVVGAPGRSVLRLEGEYWTVVFEGDAFRLRDAKGLHYLARLLAEPGREFHALDLAGSEGERGAVGAVEASEARSRADAMGHAGEVLDSKAKAAYRARLKEIDEELADAEALGDADRAERARTEREFLAAELSAALGLSGRDRVAASASERARVNVTRAIRSVISRMKAYSPALEAHLAVTVRTGTFCAYQPDPRAPVAWQL